MAKIYENRKRITSNFVAVNHKTQYYFLQIFLLKIQNEREYKQVFATENYDRYFLRKIVAGWLFNGTLYKYRYNISSILFLRFYIRETITHRETGIIFRCDN